MRVIYLFIAIIFCIGNLCAQVNLDSGLVAYYPFNGNANDESGHGHDGTVMGATLTADRFSNDSSAYSFDGVNDIIDFGDTFNDVVVPFSISLWVFKDQLGPAGQGIIASDNSPNVGGNYYGFWLNMVNPTYGNSVAITLGDGGSPDPSSRRGKYTVTPVPFNEWIHLAVIVRSVTDISFYYDAFDVGGVLSGTGGAMVHNNWPANMGMKTGNVNQVFYNGVMDDFRIYDRSLTFEEVDSLFNENPITSIDIENSNLLHQYELRQNYPNPYNPTTKIKFQIPEVGFVTVKVYDVLGNEVASLVNEEKPVGTYEITWYAESLPSGIYFYRMHAGDFIQTKKMVLMK